MAKELMYSSCFYFDERGTSEGILRDLEHLHLHTIRWSETSPSRCGSGRLCSERGYVALERNANISTSIGN